MIALLSRTRSSSSSFPTRSPIFRLGTAVILSTIKLLRRLKPFRSEGSMRSRKSGASVGSVVKAHTVTEAVASNASSWITTAGRGFPA